MEEKTGRILKKRDIGGIKFFVILEEGGNINTFIVRKDIVSQVVFNKSQKLKMGDIINFSFHKSRNDLIIFKIEKLYSKERNAEFLFKNSQDIKQFLLMPFIKDKIREFFRSINCIEVDLPIIHWGRIKQDAFYIENNYFTHKARLSTSNALYLNIIAFNLMKAFTFTRTFRSEPSKSRKHLSEFTMLEFAALNMDMEEVMGILENLIKFLLKEIYDSPLNEVVSSMVFPWIDKPFRRGRYNQVNEKFGLLGKGVGKYETVIAKEGPIFVIGFPPNVATWSAELRTVKETVSFNLLLPNVGEVAEGNQKMTNIEILKKKFIKAGVYEQLAWYLRLSPYNKVKISGVGVGIERLLMWILGISNIRKIVPFFRDWRFGEEKYGKIVF